MKYALALAGLALSGCGDRDVFTLYRGSETGPLRIHVATFDSANGATYNRESCDLAQRLFAAQRGVRVRYWCEFGRFAP